MLNAGSKYHAGRYAIPLLIVLTMVAGMCADWLIDKSFEKELSRTIVIEKLDLLHEDRPVVYDGEEIRPLTYSLIFDGMAVDDNYDNFFQFADANSIRLELQHPKKLFLIIGDDNLVKVADDIQMNHWYRYDLRGIPGKYIRFYIDGKLVFESRAYEVVNKKLDYSRTLFGSGYADQRRLQGGIRNLRFSMTGTEDSKLKYPVQLLSGCIFGLAIVWLLSKIYRASPLHISSMSMLSVYDQMSMPVIYLMIAFIGVALMKKGFPYAKWSVLISTGFLLASSPLLPERVLLHKGRLKGFLMAVAAIMFAMIIVALANDPDIIKSNITASYLLALVMPIAYGIARLPFQVRNGVPLLGERAHLHESAVFVLISVCTFFSFSDLQNWTLVVQAAKDEPGRTAMLVITGAVLTVLVTDRIFRKEHVTANSNRAGLMLVSLLACILFGVLALRTDMLFTGTSMLHWEYYAGVIRSIRSGGWLLYDTPSQYGFTPMLLAAAIPVNSSWDAFYWLQSSTMLIAAALLYAGAVRFARMPAPIAAVLTAFLVFFSYPGMIGPAPYPSSGPMRFIWCYVLLYCAGAVFTRDQPTVRRYVTGALPFWIMGVFWSGESAVYSTSIYLAPVGGELLKRLFVHKAPMEIRRNQFREALALFAVPFAILMLFMLLVSAAYVVLHGVWPDWLMHFAYGFAYAKGFGEFDIPFNGPIWLLLLLLMVGFMSVSMSIRKNRDDGRDMLALAATACIWSVSSYYVGRAVPNNIVAIFPVLVFALLLIMKSWPEDQTPIIPSAICGAVLFLAFVSPLSNEQLPKLIANMNFRQATVIPNLAKADPELLGLMDKAGISDTSRVVYYGNDAALPGICDQHGCRVYEKTWLPNPLQLMEAPVPEQRQRELIGRWAARRRYAGYIVHKRGDAENRLAVWLSVLSESYAQAAAWESKNYRILLFTRK